MLKKESFVAKGNKKIAAGDTLAAMKSVEEGLDYYQNTVVKALNPYPSADAALVVTVLRTLAKAIEDENPDCKMLVEELEKKAKAPAMKSREKVHCTRRR